jgi:hypothetical protein
MQHCGARDNTQNFFFVIALTASERRGEYAKPIHGFVIGGPITRNADLIVRTQSVIESLVMPFIVTSTLA